MKWEVLNTRERKKLAKRFAQDYGVSEDALSCVELIAGGGDIWAVAREALAVQLDVGVDSFGIQLIRGGIPTVAGVQALFSSAERTSLSASQARDFIDGKPVPGCGKIAFYGSSPIDLAEPAGQGFIRRMRR